MRLVFIASPYQNAFFHELRDALIDACHANGVEAIVCFEPDEHTIGDEDVFVVCPPHEWETIEGPALLDDARVAARTIGISAEQPHQVFFERNVKLAARLGAVLDFSRRAVDEYHRRGVEADHLPFGYVPAWNRTELRRTTHRNGVLYLGNKAPRRLGALAGAATELADQRARLIVSDNSEPNWTTSPSFLAGDDKRQALAAARVVVNIHQSDEPYFEWLRFADAVHCGAPVLSETSMGTSPFRPGEHFIDFAPGGLADALRSLPSQDDLDATAAAALDVLRSRPLSEGVTSLLEAAIRIVATTRPPRRLAPRQRSEPLGRDRTDPLPAPGWPTRRARLRSVATKLAGVGPRTVAPDLVAWRGTPPRVPRDAGFVSMIVDGCDAAGRPSLEGLWPWEPWRLRHGQHLGRVLLVDNVVAATAEQWCTEPWAADHPHVVVQLFCAVHGIRGAHVPSPIASLDEVVIDPSHRLPDDVAARCRAILDQSTPVETPVDVAAVVS